MLERFPKKNCKREINIKKKISLHKMSCYPEPDIYGQNKIKVELDLSNYAIKFDLKVATDTGTWDFAKKTN